jgi:hypothetical protein
VEDSCPLSTLRNVTEINSNELTLILNGGQIPLSKAGKKISLKREIGSCR